jgi:hypothetical protein
VPVRVVSGLSATFASLYTNQLPVKWQQLWVHGPTSATKLPSMIYHNRCSSSTLYDHDGNGYRDCETPNLNAPPPTTAEAARVTLMWTCSVVRRRLPRGRFFGQRNPIEYIFSCMSQPQKVSDTVYSAVGPRCQMDDARSCTHAAVPPHPPARCWGTARECGRNAV